MFKLKNPVVGDNKHSKLLLSSRHSAMEVVHKVSAKHLNANPIDPRDAWPADSTVVTNARNNYFTAALNCR
jgi:hypothetical protein